MPEKKTAASAANEYIVRNRMTHWQKTYPHWVSVASIIVLLLFWEAICRCGLVSPLFCRHLARLSAPCLPCLLTAKSA